MASIREYKSTHWALKKFRAAALAMKPQGGETLRRIIAVGVAFDPVMGFRCRDDAKFMKNVFANLSAAKISVSPDFVFVPVDLQRGQDFLDPRNVLKGDLLVFAFIAHNDHPDRSKDLFAASFMGRIATASFSLTPPFVSCRGVAPCFLLSPHDKGQASWDEATARVNPKVIISYVQTDKDVCAKASTEYSGEGMPNIAPYADTETRILLRRDCAAQLG